MPSPLPDQPATPPPAPDALAEPTVIAPPAAPAWAEPPQVIGALTSWPESTPGAPLPDPPPIAPALPAEAPAAAPVVDAPSESIAPIGRDLLLARIGTLSDDGRQMVSIAALAAELSTTPAAVEAGLQDLIAAAMVRLAIYPGWVELTPKALAGRAPAPAAAPAPPPSTGTPPPVRGLARWFARKHH